MDVGAMKLLVAAHQEELTKAMSRTRSHRSVRLVIGRWCIRIGLRLVGAIGRSGSVEARALVARPCA
jgi:hypothetical protein